MGALLAYEIVRSGVARTGPLHLFVAACRPPHDVGSNPRLHDLSSSDLRETLGRIGTNSVLSSTDLFDAVEETLRADLQAVETYTLTQSPPLSASLTALCGAADPLAPPDAVSGWSDYTAERFVRHVYPGDHFFIEHNEEAVVSLVESTCRMFP
jgi:surfactin synthase thioesterase subunit